MKLVFFVNYNNLVSKYSIDQVLCSEMKFPQSGCDFSYCLNDILLTQIIIFLSIKLCSDMKHFNVSACYIMANQGRKLIY